MSEKEIFEEFERLHKSALRSKTARLRDLYDQIEALKKRGFTHATIISAMKKHGLDFDLKTFEVTVYRIKKERTKPAKVDGKETGNTELQTQINKSEESTSNTPSIGSQTGGGKNPLHALAGSLKKGDFNGIAKATFEVDEN
ncbi:hypothetical protein D3C72_151120 [compost metagenome]